MKRLALLFPILLALLTTDANAWFFFFIPASVTNKIGDALTGAEGDSCVPAAAKVGDVIPSASGNKATVKSLSGTSSRCQDPRYPIRALLAFEYTFASKAGINVPEGYEQKPLTDMQRFGGALLRAENSSKRMSFMVNARPRTPANDLAAIARGVGANMMAVTVDAKTSHEEELSIKGMRALRFEMEAKNKGLFGATFTYVVTVIEGGQEVVIVNAWTPTKGGDFEKEREELRQIAYGVEGLNLVDGATVPPGAMAQAPAALGAAASDVAPNMSAVTSTAASAPTVPEAVATVPDGQPGQAESAAASAAASASAGESVANRLRTLEKLCQERVLSQSECEAKKRELLKAL